MFKQVLDKVYPDYNDKIDMYDVDIDKETDMAIQFGARSIPYLVLISKGGEATAQMGSLDENGLRYYLDGLISKK